MEPSITATSAKNKKRLEFDWSKLLGESDDPPPELVVTSSTADAESRNPSEDLTAAMEADKNLIARIEYVSDDEINRHIIKYRGHKKLPLPDNGARLDSLLERLEAEKERRKLFPVEKGQKEFLSSKQSVNLSKNCFQDASDALSKERTLSNEGLPSTFSAMFSKRLDNTESRSSLGSDKVPSNRRFFTMDRNKASSRQQPFQSPMLGKLSSGDQRGISAASSPNLRGSSVTSHAKKSNEHFMCSKDSKPAQEQMVVLDEEDEGQLEIIECPDEFAECMEDATIYYPSRDDPDSVEICYKDKKCLDPEGYLTSPIMNFYIAYLQQKASYSDKGISDYHFFNTYFYKKLQDAVSQQKNDYDCGLFVLYFMQQLMEDAL